MQQLCCLVCHFYPRSPHGERPSITSEIARLTTSISIHALRMESDARRKYNRYAANYFYPRSPHGERLKKTVTATDEQLDFYPRSPHGERQLILRGILARPKFLSTLSAWRATPLDNPRIQALLFLSTLSAWRATKPIKTVNNHKFISIHALRMESDYDCQQNIAPQKDFYPRSPHGERPLASLVGFPSSSVFLSTLSAWRATANYNKILRRFREKCKEIYKIESAIAY